MNPRPKISPSRVLFISAMTVFWFYIFACVFVTVFQRNFIYHPPVFDSNTLNQMGKRAGLERWRNAAGQDIGWKSMASVQPARAQLLVTYGNGSYAVGVHHYADAVRASDWNVYILEYPGYADRSGRPSQASLFAAANQGLAALPTNCPTYLLGESLGTGVAAYLAGTHPSQIHGVVLLAPFNKLADVAQAHMPWFPVPWLLFDRFNSVAYLQHYHGPIAIFTGTSDRVVPDKFGLRLFVSYDGPKKLWEFPGDDHGAVFGRFDGKWPEVKNFWQNAGQTLHSAAQARP